MRSSLPTRGRSLAALAIAGLSLALLPVFGTVAPAESENPWTKVEGNPIAARSAKQADIRTDKFAGFTLDREAMQGDLSLAPRAAAAGKEVLLPTPEGTFERFSLVDAPVMEEKLAAAHPEIKTYAGKGIDDPTATVRADLTPLGFHASVRSKRGHWYVDPYYHRDQSLYASYYGHNLRNDAGPLVENEEIEEVLQDALPADAGPIVKLRTYRLALVTDPSYANYFGAENVTAAKVTLVNRVAQIYEDETAIRLVLVNDTDKTNLNTAAEATGANGPCGAAPCFTTSQLAGCSSGLLNRNQIVLGQLIGAGSYDVGHIGLGLNGGGIAGLGVVGGSGKARGCTGLPTPVGDFFAVDYVAHEIGHQFAGNHTFNGTQGACSGGNRSAANSYEPGSGSSIMAYAGICGQDNLQPHSDPYWSQRSFTEITTFTSTPRAPINEVQNIGLRDFDGTDSFTLSYNGKQSAPIVRGTNYTAAGIKAAIEGIEGWPAGATVAVAGFGNTLFNDTGFQVTFQSGAVAAVDVPSLGFTGTGTTAVVGETVDGGPQENTGFKVEDTTNHAPVVTAAAQYTIPLRTPFSLTGTATDADGDKLTYMWEQNDRGGSLGTALVNNVKKDGPLFRQFGTAAIVSDEDTLKYYSPGQNAVNDNPTRVFPDMQQVAANNTNAEAGACPAAPAPPATVPAALVDCYSEFLPTADWVGLAGDRTLHFRLTARDYRAGGGGVGSADTALVLAPDTGPFLVTSQNTAGTTYQGGSAQDITWDVAGTNAAPVNAAEVKISLSTDGGVTFPHVLAERTANDGSESLALPDVATEKARIRIEAVGNVFFDLNAVDFTIQASPRVTAPAGATVQYSDAASFPVTANDPDSPVEGLTATAAGLPAGLSLTQAGPGSWNISGTTTAAPGDYPVSVSVTDSTGVVGKSSFPIKVTPEDAAVTYTGDSLVDGGSVLLRATVRDNTDNTPGDVLSGTLTFTAGDQTLCTASLAPLGTGPADASGNCTAQLPAGVHEVTASVGGNYTGKAPGRVEVTNSRNSLVIGNGSVPLSKAYGADNGTRADFTLAVTHVNGQSTGASLVTFTSGGKKYQIRSVRVDSFGSSRMGTIDMRGRAELVDVTDHWRPKTVAAGLTLRVTGKVKEGMAITLFDGSKLVFSTAWNGASTDATKLARGTLVVL
ncbi:M12 family metallo-peptidase [Kibdelosporangium persicum]|uniref:Metallo-peptidase family M12B Reprolysin-like n=1 Tax=Kibdelosporangium persicum TaxID=2698649 RepID=A0ABX2FGL9_9PSEU|nr:M12 family metallo-peptidase [Kibdelosporangium persicum]NRN69913.1 Metallo-peptidase family M12B Reprolysin-like [Kibdelosporangium persicum]